MSLRGQYHAPEAGSGLGGAAGAGGAVLVCARFANDNVVFEGLWGCMHFHEPMHANR